MKIFNSRSILRTYRPALLASVASVFALSVPLQAQEEVWPSNSEAHPGEIVYSRDVPFGTATRRFAQGEARTVAPDQSVLIENSLLIGLEPITDAEHAAVSAPLQRSLLVSQEAMEGGLSVVTQSVSNTDFTRSESAVSSTGAVISNALGVLPSALSVINQVTGSDQ